MEAGLGPGSALVLNYYQPWTYAGSERFIQLAREELRTGRAQAFVYVTAAGLEEVIEQRVHEAEYARLALYHLVGDDAAAPVSPYARTLTGNRPLSLDALIEALRPTYVRAHFPAEAFVPALESDAFRRVPFIYDVMDLWDAFAACPWGDSEVERWYVKRADATINVSQLLVDYFPEATRAFLVPNGVDRLFLRRIAPDGPSSRPAGRPKRVLYMGSMGGNWFDWPLVRRLPRELPDHEFTLLGSAELPPEEYDGPHQRYVAECLADLRSMPNVRICPEVPHDELVPWLRDADVGLIPFRHCDLVRAVSPLKAYEYLAAGAVVVQSGMPDIESYPGVRTASDADTFITHVREADRCLLTPAEAAAMALFAERSTWSARLADFDRVVGDVLADHDHTPQQEG